MIILSFRELICYYWGFYGSSIEEVKKSPLR